HRELGRVGLVSGDLASAERHLNEALEAFDGTEARFEVAVTELDLAELARLKGDFESAAARAEICRRRFEEHGARTYVERGKRLAELSAMRSQTPARESPVGEQVTEGADGHRSDETEIAGWRLLDDV